MNERLICKVCGKGYWRNQQWIHDRCATNNATNTVATNNGPIIQKEMAIPEAPESRVQAVHGIAEKEPRTQNRRSRDDYNAYQRDYMRKRRANQKDGIV